MSKNKYVFMSKEICLYVPKEYVFMSKRNMSLCLKETCLYVPKEQAVFMSDLHECQSVKIYHCRWYGE